MAKQAVKSAKKAPEMPLIYGKILSIMEQVQPVKKGGTVSFGKTNYSYQKAEDMVAAIRELMIAEKVIVYPVKSVGEMSIITSTDQPFLTPITITYRFIAIEDGSYIEAQMPAQGYDSGDKGVYKALTGAYKYVIKQTFMIESGEDDYDRDASPASSSSTTKTETSGGYILDGVPYEYKSITSKKNGKTYVGYIPEMGAKTTSGKKARWFTRDQETDSTKRDTYKELEQAMIEERGDTSTEEATEVNEEVDPDDLPF